MKPKQSPSTRDELGKIDFIPTMKPKGVNKNIGENHQDVKQALESCMSIFFEHMKEGLPSLARLQREAREGRDG